MSEEKYELVKFVDNGFELEVNVSPTEGTVWLTQEQMSMLFQKAKSTINWHINNAFEEGELSIESKKFEKIEFSKKPTNYYNLDVVIAVGYRVKSLRGVLFRKWATKILKQYMLRGYIIDQSRVMVTNENYLNLVNVVTDMKSSQLRLEDRVEKLEDRYPDIGNKIFFLGQMWDATSCIEQIISKAKESIILIDNYVDRITLDMLLRKKPKVPVSIYTMKRHCNLSEKEKSDFRVQYGPLSINYTDEFHDRFLILDRKELYHIGASIKDAGKKAFEISKNEELTILKSILERLDISSCPGL